MMGARAASRMAVTANDTIATAASVAPVVACLIWSEVDMKFAIATCAVMLATAFTTDTLRAQGTVQSITASRVDVVQLASGYRASKVIGSTVYNDGRDTIGTIDDLIVNPRDSVTYAILSVGGFLGLGTHLVAVPFGSLRVVDKQMHLPGATRDSLKALPEFRYASP
jgi:PRC-barrel domain